jgi:hypothetical protein
LLRELLAINLKIARTRGLIVPSGVSHVRRKAASAVASRPIMN